MKYFELDFKITPFSTDAADLLMTLVGEAGLESFVETEDGFKGYAQERLFHQEALDEMSVSSLTDYGSYDIHLHC